MQELVVVVDWLTSFYLPRQVGIWEALVKQLDRHQWSGLDDEDNSEPPRIQELSRLPPPLTKSRGSTGRHAPRWPALHVLDTISGLDHRVYQQLLSSAISRTTQT